MPTPFTQGVFRIVLQDRVTKRPLSGCKLDPVIAQFTREPRLFSEAFVQLASAPTYDCTTCSSSSCDCQPNGREVELAFYRDDWPEAAWIGPVVSIQSSDSSGLFTIVARDRLWWLQGATSDRDFSETVPVNQAFIRLVQSGDRYQPSGLRYDDAEVPDSDVLFTMDTEVDDLIWSPLLALDQLVFWTVVGEQLYHGAPQLPLKCGQALASSSSWLEGGVDAERSFTSIATRVRVVGKDGITGVFPKDGDAEPINGQGKRTIEVANTGLDTQDEVDAVARSLFFANRFAADFVVSGESSLGPKVQFGLHNLIPGRCHDVAKDTGCLQTSDNKLLSRVVVDIAAVAGENGEKVLREIRVAADFSPIDTQSQSTAISA